MNPSIGAGVLLGAFLSLGGMSSTPPAVGPVPPAHGGDAPLNDHALGTAILYGVGNWSEQLRPFWEPSTFCAEAEVPHEAGECGERRRQVRNADSAQEQNQLSIAGLALRTGDVVTLTEALSRLVEGLTSVPSRDGDYFVSAIVLGEDQVVISPCGAYLVCPPQEPFLVWIIDAMTQSKGRSVPALIALASANHAVNPAQAAFGRRSRIFMTEFAAARLIQAHSAQ